MAKIQGVTVGGRGLLTGEKNRWHELLDVKNVEKKGNKFHDLT